MTAPTQGIRGMNDVCPVDMPYWHQLEALARDTLSRYCYSEIRLPVVEKTDLFCRTIGEVTDIVEKEMYTFQDRNGDSLSLRPEGTAGCVRAGIQQGLLYNQVQRLWYTGPMFRHERPQKGRYRQFFQMGVEAFGLPGPEIEAEQLLLFWRLLKALGLSDQVTLEINTLGSPECRQQYREQLVAYFESHREALDEESLRRLDQNPLRLLDSKHPDMQSLLAQAPVMGDCLSDASQAHFQRLLTLLDHAGVPYQCNPRLVRGLDYYCHTVYEWTTSQLGAQGTVCAGGRYDGLVKRLGGKPTPAVGFAMGLERLVLLLQQQATLQEVPDVYIILVGEPAMTQGVVLAEQLREAIPSLRVMMQASAASMKSQFKQADNSGAQWACIIGETECESNTITLKHLRDRECQQQSLSLSSLMEFFKGV
ncbi:MAG: histidine--tRNA ligase [Legionellales bacterium]|nr:histidine--tRNA ligase [Legionellales bacterium]HAG61835.1 histidine--tRNA ligase [Coxiellaceae bacterium]